MFGLVIFMDKEIISILSNVVIATSTFFGVAAAIAYYLTEIIGKNLMHVILIELEYFLVVIILLILIERNIKSD